MRACVPRPRPETVTDVLGEPYLAETLELPPDEEGAVVATLVHRAAAGPTTKAVLHVHGFADYFFQTEYAEWWTERGYDFYALDLRKYGRSLRPHQTPNYVTDLREYYAELDEAWQRITERDGHTEVVALRALDRRPGRPASGPTSAGPAELTGLVLNSPWLDLQGSALLRVVGTPVLKQLGAPPADARDQAHVTGLYGRSLHRDHEGEWDFDLLWKPIESFTVYAGWLRAIREGHAALHRGLDLPCPVLVLSSGRSALPEEMGEDVHGTDIVLDVEQIRRWATAYGPHVTYVAVEGARHDVVLSRAEPRARGYDAVQTWLSAWVDPPSAVPPLTPPVEPVETTAAPLGSTRVPPLRTSRQARWTVGHLLPAKPADISTSSMGGSRGTGADHRRSSLSRPPQPAPGRPAARRFGHLDKLDGRWSLPASARRRDRSRPPPVEPVETTAAHVGPHRRCRLRTSRQARWAVGRSQPRASPAPRGTGADHRRSSLSRPPQPTRPDRPGASLRTSRQAR